MGLHGDNSIDQLWLCIVQTKPLMPPPFGTFPQPWDSCPAATLTAASAALCANGGNALPVSRAYAL